MMSEEDRMRMELQRMQRKADEITDDVSREVVNDWKLANMMIILMITQNLIYISKRLTSNVQVTKKYMSIFVSHNEGA